MPRSRDILLGTDCSGMETPVMALRRLGVKMRHVFSCDVNKFAKKTIMENFPPKIFYDDLTKRDNTKAPKTDLYVAGFPCQPFSTAGLQQGFQDVRGRGEIFWHVRDYLEKQEPRAFVLENVSGLVKINSGVYFKSIIEALEALGTYNVYKQVMNTLEHGVPQNRGRIYFVGIHKRFDNGSFCFPEPLPHPSIETFLHKRKGRPSTASLPAKTQGTARGNVVRALAAIRAKGHDPLKEPFIVDCDSSPARMKFVLDATPCLTCARFKGHWVTNRMRRLTKEEMMRLQGMEPKDFKVVVSEAQLGRQIGNAMSVNVLERLFVRLLPAARLVSRKQLADTWQAKVPLQRPSRYIRKHTCEVNLCKAARKRCRRVVPAVGKINSLLRQQHKKRILRRPPPSLCGKRARPSL